MQKPIRTTPIEKRRAKAQNDLYYANIALDALRNQFERLAANALAFEFDLNIEEAAKEKAEALQALQALRDHESHVERLRSIALDS
jgi:hypothetical protein